MSKYDVFEEAIEKLQKRIDVLEERLVETTSRITDAIYFLMYDSDLTSRFRTLASVLHLTSKDGIRTSIKTLLNAEKEFINSQKAKILKEKALERARYRMNLVLDILKGADFTFDDISSLIVRIFGANAAKKIVPLDKIIELYGSDNASKWKELIGAR